MIKEFIEPELLKDNCFSSHFEKVVIRLESDQLNDYRQIMETAMIHEKNRLGIIKLISTKLKKFDVVDLGEIFKSIEKLQLGHINIKSLKSMIAESLEIIEKGYFEEDQQVFLFDYQEENSMGVYAESGKLLYTRPLLKNEKNLFSDNVKSIVNG